MRNACTSRYHQRNVGELVDYHEMKRLQLVLAWRRHRHALELGIVNVLAAFSRVLLVGKCHVLARKIVPRRPK